MGTAKRVFIGIPVYGGVDPNFTECLLDLIAKVTGNPKLLGEDVESVFFRFCKGDSLVSRARNHLTAEFLSTDCNYLVMLDSDLIFSPEHVRSVLSHGEALVGGFYPKKKEGYPEYVCNSLDGGGVEDARGLVTLKYIGTGFICVRRDVLEKMIEVYEDGIGYSQDDNGRHEHDFWTVGVYRYPDGSKRYLSEDWYFCQRALDLGYKVYGDSHVALKHCGAAIYPLQYQQKAFLSGGATPGEFAKAQTVPSEVLAQV